MLGLDDELRARTGRCRAGRAAASTRSCRVERARQRSAGRASRGAATRLAGRRRGLGEHLEHPGRSRSSQARPAGSPTTAGRRRGPCCRRARQVAGREDGLELVAGLARSRARRLSAAVSGTSTSTACGAATALGERAACQGRPVARRQASGSGSGQPSSPTRTSFDVGTMPRSSPVTVLTVVGEHDVAPARAVSRSPSTGRQSGNGSASSACHAISVTSVVPPGNSAPDGSVDRVRRPAGRRPACAGSASAALPVVGRDRLGEHDARRRPAAPGGARERRGGRARGQAAARSPQVQNRISLRSS